MTILPVSLPKQFRQWLLPRRRLAIAEACLIGLVSGLSAVLLKQSVGWFGSLRIQASEWLPASLVLPAFGLCLGLLCGVIVESLAIEATGSGIPQIKGALAQFPIALNLRVAIVKLISSILSMSAGLTLGRQGPTVHIGAALAGQLSHWVPTSPDHRRQMIAAGAGAGLAAGFNAPLAGILFVVEELLRDLSNLTLGTAILASFIGAVVSRLLGGGSLDLNLQLSQHTSSFSAPEIPFYLLLGVLAGVFGALLNQGLLASLTFYERLNLSLPLKIGLAGMICGCVVALLPSDFRNNSGLRDLLLTGDASWQFTAVAFVAYFILTLVSYGSGAPGGLFHPSLVLGAALGYLVGVSEVQVLGAGSPTSYALAGMGAFFSAVSKVPITAIVIVFEMTTNFNLVLPLMITCGVSYLIADKLAKGSLYQRLLELKGYTLPTQTTEKTSLAGLTAADLMQRRVETLASQMTLDEAIQAFSRSHHRGFPVVDQGELIGIITQTDVA
ncbi:MAG: chloride channel protein, partial [Coleofasciculus sp. Co-bin14]|nr:chloride channel protein [Coleofasciculus sp. Co-bin14]